MSTERIPTMSGHPYWCEKTSDCDDTDVPADLHHIGYRSRLFVENGATRISVDVHRHDVTRTSWAEVISSGVQLEIEDLESVSSVVRSWMTPADARAIAHLLVTQADLAERELRFATNAGSQEVS